MFNQLVRSEVEAFLGEVEEESEGDSVLVSVEDDDEEMEDEEA